MQNLTEPQGEIENVNSSISVKENNIIKNFIEKL